jgi:hypothetical protein
VRERERERFLIHNSLLRGRNRTWLSGKRGFPNKKKENKKKERLIKEREKKEENQTQKDTEEKER